MQELPLGTRLPFPDDAEPLHGATRPNPQRNETVGEERSELQASWATNEAPPEPLAAAAAKEVEPHTEAQAERTSPTVMLNGGATELPFAEAPVGALG